jgi:hypothetical protein
MSSIWLSQAVVVAAETLVRVVVLEVIVLEH